MSLWSATFPPGFHYIICSSSTASQRTTPSTWFTTHNKQTPMNKSIMGTLQGGRGSKLQSKSKRVIDEPNSWRFQWKGRAGCSSLSADGLWEHKAAYMQKVRVVVGIFFALKGPFCFLNLPPLLNPPALKGWRNYVERDKTTQTVYGCVNKQHRSQVLCCGCSEFPVKWILIKLKEKKFVSLKSK